MLKSKEPETALTRALKLISKMPKTEKEVKDYLYKKEYRKPEVEEVLARLKELGYINDEFYARAYTESKSKKYGHKMISMKLSQKGVKKDVAADAVKQIDNAEEVAMGLAEKYMKGNRTKEQLYRYLLSKGFDYEICNRVVKNESRN